MGYKKKYNEALERARKLYEQGTITESLNYVFPELKESEDERVRKRIIHALHGDVLDMEETTKALAWLEEQGEKSQGKTALEAAKEEKIDNSNKVEPKFHEGDWIIHRGTENVYQVVACIDNQYQLRYGDNYTIQKCDDVDRNTRFWTIKDAKPGDVLASNNGVIILVKESRGSSWGYRLSYYCAVLYDGTFEPREFHVDPEKFFPATKEQRDTLFARMREAGYEWDAEKKEIKRQE